MEFHNLFNLLESNMNFHAITSIHNSEVHRCRPLTLALVCIMLARVTCVSTFSSDTKSIVNSYPIVYENGNDNYLLLSDDELVHNADILRYLSSSGKEEIEEILDENPMIQNQLLDRITKILRQRERKNPRPMHHVTPQVSGGALENPTRVSPTYLAEQQVHQLNDEYDDDDDDEGSVMGPNKKKGKKLHMLRAKLKKKAMKLFKIGSKLKKKILKMRKRKAKLGQGGYFRIADGNYTDNEANGLGHEPPATRRPRFRFRITTS